jgi:exonuclease III
MQSNGNSIDRLRNFTLWNGYTGVIRYIREGQSKSHFYVALTHGRSRYIYSRIEVKMVFSLHCPYGYSKRPKKQSVIIIKQVSSTNLFSAKQIL